MKNKKIKGKITVKKGIITGSSTGPSFGFLVQVDRPVPEDSQRLHERIRKQIENILREA